MTSKIPTGASLLQMKKMQMPLEKDPGLVILRWAYA